MAFEKIGEVSRFDLLAGREDHAVAGTMVDWKITWLRREMVIVIAVILGNLVHVEFVEHI